MTPEHFGSGNSQKEENVLFPNFRFTETGAISAGNSEPRMKERSGVDDMDESFNETGAIQLRKITERRERSISKLSLQ